MAILERPFYGDEARGRIKNTLVFLKRVANVNYTDEEPGERFIINALRAPRQAHGDAREEWKEVYRAAVSQWRGLSEAEKGAYWTYAEGLETNFNVFLREVIGGEEVMPQPFDGPVLIAILNDSLKFSGGPQPRDYDLVVRGEIPEGGALALGPETLTFSYSIP